MQRGSPLLRAALAALFTSVSCSEDLLYLLSRPPIPGLPCPKGPRDLQALWSTSVYDKGNRPQELGQPVGSWPPTDVSVTFIPFSLGAFNTQAQLMTVDVEIAMLWWDPRIAFNASCASELAPPHVLGTQLQGSWMPSIFDDPHATGLWMPRFAIDNLFPSGSAPGFFSRAHMLRVESSGLVWYSVRASVDVKCSMDFSKMPWDVQRCPIRMMALEGVNRVNLSLVTDPRVDEQIFQAQETLDAMSSVEWKCQKLTQEAGSYHGSFGRTYDEDRAFIELKIVLQRNDRYWRIHVITPTILLLAISWASFFIARAAVPARVAMCALPPTPLGARHPLNPVILFTPRSIICYLTLTNLAGSVNASIPKVSYNVALIDFVQFSRWCVFYSIIEYSLANWLMRVEKRIEAAAVKMAKQEAAREEAVRGSMDVPPGTVVELGEVQVNGNADPTMGSKRRRVKSTVLSQAASSSVLKKRNGPAVREHLCGIDRYLVNSTGYLAIRDQHLDIFSRYAYPFACIIGIVILNT